MMAYTGAPAPDGIWSRIVESLEEPPPELDLPVRTPGADTELGATVTSLSDRRRLRRWLPMSAVAAALVVVGLVAGVLISGDDQPSVPRWHRSRSRTSPGGCSTTRRRPRSR